GFALGLTAHELFDDAVFQGVEADHHQPATDLKRIESRFKASLEIAQLIIDMDAQSLEGAGGRVLALLPRRIGLGEYRSQIGGTGERLLSTPQHHRTSHALGKTLLAVFLEDSGDFIF